MFFTNVLKLFIYLNVMFVLKGLFCFCSRKFYFYFTGVGDSSDLDTRVQRYGEF